MKDAKERIQVQDWTAPSDKYGRRHVVHFEVGSRDVLVDDGCCTPFRVSFESARDRVASLWGKGYRPEVRELLRR